jgi:hypothetical protein
MHESMEATYDENGFPQLFLKDYLSQLRASSVRGIKIVLLVQRGNFSMIRNPDRYESR